jgi:hypothetical protein
MLMPPTTTAVATRNSRYEFPRSGADINSPAGSMELMGTRISYARNVEIFGEGEPAEYLYKVVSGSVRSCKMPLDLILVRKIRAPMQSELAIGAVVDGSEPIIVRNEDIIQLVGVSETEFKAICAAELAEIERRRECSG